MATFDYTQKGWDKNRPTFLSSTGLGEALKQYEVAKAKIRYEFDTYLEAAQLLKAVEAKRAVAINACKSKDATRTYLESAKPEEELGFLQAIYANKMINVLQTVQKEIKPLLKYYEIRIEILSRGVPAWKAYAEEGTPIEPKLNQAMKELVGFDSLPPTKPDKLIAVLDLAAKGSLLKGKALGVVADKCNAVVEEMKRYGELKTKMQQEIEEAKLYDTRIKGADEGTIISGKNKKK